MSKFVIDPSLGKYRIEPGLFDDYLPKLLEDVQPQMNDEELQEQPATIGLSIPIGRHLPAAVPIPAAAAPAPPPVLRPEAILPPPPPDPEPFVPPPPEQNEGLPNDGEVEGESTAADILVDDELRPDENIVDHNIQEPQRIKRKAATEARDKIYSQIRFSNDVRYHPIPPCVLQPRKYGLRTVDGHEVAPVTFRPRSSQKANQDKIRKKAVEANESFPTREKKKSFARESYQRAKTFAKSNDAAGNRQDTINSIHKEKN